MVQREGGALVCPICDHQVNPPTYDGLSRHILRYHPTLWRLLEERPPPTSKAAPAYIR